MGSPTRLMLKWQKNQIFEAIQTGGLDPREFDLDDDGTEVRIKCRRSESIFSVGLNAGHYAGRSVVGDGMPWPYDAFSWPALMSRVSQWLEEVKRDLEMPDLWAELQRAPELLGVGSAEIIENTPFTLDEQREIARRLQELAEDARRKYSLSEAQMRVLEAKLEYVVDAVGRLGRNDWRNILIGTIFSYVLIAALPPESARDIFLTFLRGISHLYGLPELLGH